MLPPEAVIGNVILAIQTTRESGDAEVLGSNASLQRIGVRNDAVRLSGLGSASKSLRATTILAAAVLIAGALGGCSTQGEAPVRKSATDLSLLPSPAKPGEQVSGSAELASSNANSLTNVQSAANPDGKSGMQDSDELVEVLIDGLSLADAVGLAIAKHPDINRAQAIVARSESQVAVAKSAWYPTINYGLDPGYNTSGNVHQVKAGVGLQQLVYDFGRARSNISAAKATLEQEQYLLADTIETVAFNTAATFVDLSASQEMIGAAEQQVQSLRDTKEKIEARVKAGLSDASDLNQAEVAIKRAEAEALSAQTEFDDAAGKLAELAGVRPSRVAALAATTSVVNGLHQNAVDKVDDTPAILAAKASLTAAEANVKLAKAAQFPSVGVTVSQEFSTLKDNAGDYDRYTYVGMTLSGDFSLGGLTKHKINTALAEQRAEAQVLENQRLLTRTALGSAQTQASGAAARLSSYQSVIDLSKELLDLYWQQYTLDKRPLTDVINAERDVYQSEVQRISAIADGANARIKANAAVGQLVAQLKAKKSS